MVTMPFSSIGKDTVSIKDLIVPEGVVACKDSKHSTEGAELQVWNGTGYKKYYWINDGFTDDEDDVTGWADGGEIVTTEYAPGTGFWFRYPLAQANYTLPGQVVSADSISKNVYKSKYNMIGNPYPTLLDLSKVKTTIPAVPDKVHSSKAAELQVWNGTGYKKYYYINDGFTDDEDDVTGWADGGEIVGEVGLDVTYGMWVKCLDADAVVDKDGVVGVVTFEM